MIETSNSDKETKEIGKKMASQLRGGDIILLTGELGAGKTTFVKGIAEGLDIVEDIVSPTFTLLNIYQIRNQKSKIKNLIHIDTYRLENEQQLIDIGVEDYIGNSETVSVIEWPEKMQKLFRGKKTLNVYIEHVNEGTRRITVE